MHVPDSSELTNWKQVDAIEVPAIPGNQVDLIL